MGNAYGMRSEYNNAISAFNKAIAVDPQYGKALFGKAITLRNQGNLEEAMKLANEILELYDDKDVKSFKEALIKSGVRDKCGVYSLEKAIDVMTDEAYDIIERNELLNENGHVSTEHKVYCKEEFAKSVYSYCKRRYNSLGNEKVWSESIISAFYGSICTTLLFYKDNDGFENVAPFLYLSNHIDLDDLERNAEKLLNIRQDEYKMDELWNLIYPFVTSCKNTISKVEDSADCEAAVIDATESAYVMGMSYGMRYHKQEKIQTNRTGPSGIQTKLDNLYEEIEQLSSLMPYGYKNQEIIEAVKGTGYTPEQFREYIHNNYYEKQREYNRLFDQYNLSDKRPKIVIDSFTDNSSKLSLLDPVEIDLKKRLASTSLLSKCRFLTENSFYRFYSCEFSMLREEKKSGTVVYFGHSASPACVYHEKLYWYEHGSILADKFICRCNVEDGCNVEKFEWLSNEKTGKAIGHSYHIVSEDRATSMTLEDDFLVITVQRKSIENGEYIIKIEDDGRSIHLSKQILSGNFTSSKDFSSFAAC